ncbi:MAG: DUF2254 domain-containing protein [Bacteroidales bacterium]
MKKLLFIWRELISTFWFLPILIILAALLLATAGVFLDLQMDYEPEGMVHYLFTGSADSARSVLSIIAGAMIGVAGTVFSITLVALTLASSQFGPRLLRNFMYVRINQVVLGAYVATFLYCLVVLNAINEIEQLFIPQISILIALIAAVGNIILLIIFIHNIAISIQADHIISEISISLSKNLQVLFPEKLGHDPPDERVPDVEGLGLAYRYTHYIAAPKSGYIQYIDSEKVFEQARHKNLLVILYFRPGDYLVRDMEVAEIYSDDKFEPDDLNDWQDVLIIGKMRTPHQDAEFSIHQMVEIADRALSPGINDPYTAISCIDNLTATICYLTQVKFPSKYRYDDQGQLRVMADVLTFEGMVNAAFNHIRQYAAGSPAVIIRLMEAMITISRFAKSAGQKSAVKKHARMILHLAENTFQEGNDLEDLRKRSRLILGE